MYGAAARTGKIRKIKVKERRIQKIRIARLKLKTGFTWMTESIIRSR